jgi:hypothetical protein
MAKSVVLAIPDLHIPGMLDTYPDFLWDTYKSWGCNKVVLLGDVFNFGALSFHLKRTSDMNADAEIEAARLQVKRLVKMFPEADILVGNHDDLPGRQCDVVNIPRIMLRSFNDFWCMPKTWRWHKRFSQVVIDGVIYQHGDQGAGGKFPALVNAQNEFRSVVQGHHHTSFGCVAHANSKSYVFGMQCGTGCDHHNPIFDYAKIFTKKPIVGCGVVCEGEQGFPVRMLL